MYIIKKQLEFMPETPFYRCSRKNTLRGHGTFQRHRAKLFRWWISAVIANWFFGGEIEKVHITL